MMMDEDDDFLTTLQSSLDTKGHSDVVRQAIDFASTQGILMASKDQPGLYNHAPFAALPNEFPSSEYAKARRLATAFNVLVSNPSSLCYSIHPSIHCLTTRILSYVCRLSECQGMGNGCWRYLNLSYPMMILLDVW